MENRLAKALQRHRSGSTGGARRRPTRCGRLAAEALGRPLVYTHRANPQLASFRPPVLRIPFFDPLLIFDFPRYLAGPR